MLIDTHCHLDLPPLADELAPVLARAAAAGVGRFVCPGVAPAGWDGIKALAAAHPAIRPAYGIHPLAVDDNSPAALVRLPGYLAAAVAVGEIGLDYYERSADREGQQAVFRQQLALAAACRLPVIIHCRAAFADLFRLLDEAPTLVGGVLHAFSGSIESARAAITRGFLIGVAGPVTWENARKPVELVRELPLATLLLETDAPDLAPAPYRGGVNEPANLPLIAARVAAIKGLAAAEVARVTSENAERIFHG